MTDYPALTPARHRVRAKAELDGAAAGAREAYTHLKAGAEELIEGGRDHFADAREVAQAKVREKPLLALTASLGVGILLGLLLRGPRTVYVRVPG
ncbi:hypothetical protein [Caulobacter endophyticus]|uniref:DUF883 domain-containing protein n=1 Tax=Caulobacter endophyticus TaxID=2172652 RepID=A0A2T9JU35_9CAUL|nr:hypothetical protein [Caulobacter endophyticus]PVM87186.1 hypothetical protein DDF67_14880 [Caulobacter endophyticus]